MFPSASYQSRNDLKNVQGADNYGLSNPPRARLTKATQKFGANPTTSSESMVPVHPISKTGFRPMRSERLPQSMPVKLSAKLKAAIKSPA